ncbi:MAG: aminomethyltransferase family protein, partial [Nitrospira sp.]|nr:aminomethyltransferase family protein [Nitrospira sp.]
LIRITGSDRAKFLQGLITNDVMKLTEGQGLYAAILNPKGRMLADLKIYTIHDAFLVDLDREITDKTVQILNRYKLISKAMLEDLTDGSVHLAVYGPSAHSLLEKVLGTTLTKSLEFSSMSVQWRSQQIYVIQSMYTGEQGYELLVPAQQGVALWNEILDEGSGLGMKPVGREALEGLRIEAGIPRYSIDMDENTFPPEAGLEEKAISYTKGCYVGQETIARIKTYGQVHRKLMGLILQENPSTIGISPHRHDKIFKDEEEIGIVTSSAYSPMLNRNIALGYIRRKAIQPDLQVTMVSSKDGVKTSAKVIDLPFYKRDFV